MTSRVTGYLGWLTAAAIVIGALLVPTRPATATATGLAQARVGPWQLRDSSTQPNAVADQGVATLALAKNRTMVVTRGDGSIPEGLREAGWSHIGDPDAYAGYLLDAYQGHHWMHTKLFGLTAPNGRRTYYPHALVPGESFHNSFVAIAPGGQWFVSGEWGTIRRLLVFPMPAMNRAAPSPGHNLPLAAVITLTRPMRNVQGCAFDSATTLVCSTNDPSTALYPVAKQLLSVRLAHRVDGRAMSAGVGLLGAVPHDTTCQGTAETEGLDVHGNRLLLAVITPCHVTRLYTYVRPGRPVTRSGSIG